MRRLTLSSTSAMLLQQQLRLNGSFTHRLQAHGRDSAYAVLDISQDGDQVIVRARAAGTTSTLSLDRQYTRNAALLGRYLEAAVNGCALAGLPDQLEAELQSRTEAVLQLATRRRTGSYSLDLDGLKVELCLKPTPHGTRAVLAAAGSVAEFTLPEDRSCAYARLSQRLQDLVGSFHAAQAA
ncbi:hypothetical protein [Pseudomonas sp. zfem005]|uniref:hypothetical protein n=1 Tax=Pseudomonas sp. zfem005 TaxID=3078200 RepID=UPI002927AD0F|nr:hypothetical protein [Pseudomonas sp. zfem005]MDU9415197.1 hypothetical protein [Pseudomonas sp. zfem005]